MHDPCQTHPHGMCLRPKEPPAMPHHTLAATPATTRIGQFAAAIPPVAHRPLRRHGRHPMRVRPRPPCCPRPTAPSSCPKPWPPSSPPTPTRRPATSPPAPSPSKAPNPATPWKSASKRIELGADWGFCGFRPLAGTLPEDFPHTRPVPHHRGPPPRALARLPWGTVLSLSPVLRRHGRRAARRPMGAISTKEPREHGGNLDNKEVGGRQPPCFLPVWVARRQLSQRSATATASRATARSASTPWRYASPAPSPSSLHKRQGPTPALSVSPAPSRPPTGSSAWA